MFSFDKEYLVTGKKCRYEGDNVFKQFRVIDTKEIIYLLDEDADKVQEALPETTKELLLDVDPLKVISKRVTK